jgi:coenzyme PQQ precursor peptide PqqA
MVWETPSFVEIDMSAEIGAYQGDFTPETATPTPADARTEGAA